MTAPLTPTGRFSHSVKLRNRAACMSNGKLADAIREALARLQSARGPSSITRAERRLHIFQAEADHRMRGAR